MPQGTFFGEDSFNGPKLVKVKATINLTAGSNLIPIGLDFAAGTIVPGMAVTGRGISSDTVVIGMVDGVVQLSKPITETYLSSSLTLTADENTGLGIGSMVIGSTFIVG